MRELGKLRDYTYLLILDDVDADLKPQEVKNRNELYQKLIALSQRGDLDALDILKDSLVTLIHEWIENNKWDIARLKNLPDILNDIVEQCIYGYDEKKGEFFRYLVSSLMATARRIGSIEAYSKDDESFEYRH